jgi:predicted membrane protein
MNGVEGFMYPNEVGLQWSVLIVLYPFITGLVAGAFILASLERVFRVEAVKPTYRLALLTALAFLLVAPLPLQLHLGHPERSPEMYFTPHSTSAMAMFGYVYLWYLMAVLVLEIWLDYRREIVLWSQSSKGLMRIVYKVMTLGSSNISERSLSIDERVGYIVTLIGLRRFCYTDTSDSSSVRSRQTPGGRRRSCRLCLSFRPWCRELPE